MSGAVPVSQRLKKGAQVLGKLWKDGVRCPEGFSVICLDSDPGNPLCCVCEEKTAFCRAKKQWIDLVAKEGREISEGEWGVIETMNGTELDASGLTVKTEFKDIGAHGIGPAGVMGRKDMLKLCEAPDTLGSILNMMKSFPGMKVEEILPPEEAVEAPKVAEEEFWGA